MLMMGAGVAAATPDPPSPKASNAETFCLLIEPKDGPIGWRDIARIDVEGTVEVEIADFGVLVNPVGAFL